MALSSGTYTIADLNDGTSIWTIYHDGYTKPDTPGADWATKGWSTTPTSNSVWISTKLAADINSGVWGEPMRLKGVSVTSVTPYYAVSDSSTVTPTTGWTPNLSSISWTAGQYIWTREYTVYSDNTNSWSAAHVDSAHSVITNWCDTNNKTLIDGGHIATNTVDAKSIKADSITADKIKTGEIIGAINGDTSTVKIKADKVNLVGDVVVSGDYIKSTGDVIANNTVTSTNVNCTNTKIGGVSMTPYSHASGENIVITQWTAPTETQLANGQYKVTYYFSANESTGTAKVGDVAAPLYINYGGEWLTYGSTVMHFNGGRVCQMSFVVDKLATSKYYYFISAGTTSYTTAYNITDGAVVSGSLAFNTASGTVVINSTGFTLLNSSGGTVKQVSWSTFFPDL